MRRLGNVTLTVLLLGSAPAQAEFSLTHDPISPQYQPSRIDALRPGDAASPDVDATPVPPPVFRVSNGFGTVIPLDFAVRQIVPAGVSVHYAVGVNAGTLVSWKGGRPWPTVLLAAVLPLGMHIRATQRSVSILK